MVRSLSVNERSLLFRLFMLSIRFQKILTLSNSGAVSTLPQSHSLKFGTFNDRKFVDVRTFEFAKFERVESVFDQYINSVYVIEARN